MCVYDRSTRLAACDKSLKSSSSSSSRKDVFVSVLACVCVCLHVRARARTRRDATTALLIGCWCRPKGVQLGPVFAGGTQRHNDDDDDNGHDDPTGRPSVSMMIMMMMMWQKESVFCVATQQLFFCQGYRLQDPVEIRKGNIYKYVQC